jgi:hypothetical protein
MYRVVRLFAVLSLLAVGSFLVACSGGGHPTGAPTPATSPSTAGSAGLGTAGPSAPASTGPTTPGPPGGGATGTGGSGITGVTVSTGKCPVIHDESSCPYRPVAAEFLVVDPASGTIVMTVRTGTDGRFRVAVRPGRYLLRPVGPVGAPGATATTTADVTAGRYTDVTMRLDSGIR